MIKNILLCLDGEPHTAKAQTEALALAGPLGAKVHGLYVVDPYLKKFTNEIHAVNRNECRVHLDRAMETEGQAALAEFAARVRMLGVVFETRILHGDPADTIAALALQEDFDLVITGGKVLRGWRRRFASRKLPERLNRLMASPLLIVR